MNNIDSDLEEGEIIDDIPSPVVPVRNKILPRRYDIVETKNNQHKRKKECKHAIRHHVKKLAKLKQSPVKAKTVSKNHHQSCALFKNYKKNFYNLPEPSPKKEDSNNSSYPYELENGTFKESIQNKLKARYNALISNNMHSKFDTTKTIGDNSFSKIREKYKALKKKKNSHISKIRLKNDMLVDYSKVSKVKNGCNGIASKSPEVIDISDDDEDLRQIALATCAKQNIPKETSENLTQCLNYNNVSETMKANPCLPNYVNLIADNYEVVDMDLDENDESSSETTDSLFIIDTTPSTGFQTNTNSLPKDRKVVYCSDDDFEVDMLRAELIESMCHRSDSTKGEEANGNTPDDTSQVPHEACKPHIPENFRIDKGSIKTNVRSIAEIETISSPKRLIISLNGESSSEESDAEQETSPAVSENPVASIEALISDIRQKSDSNEKSNNEEIVPKAVSCLSKAQQEEYNALTKILAQKQKVYPMQQEEMKSKFVHSPMEDLRRFEGKLMCVEEVFKKRKEKMTNLSKEVFTKKQIYMKAKLSAQHLKEQYVLAEKTRRIKLDSWSKSCKNFDAMKKSVSELEGKIDKLQNMCTKVGSCIQGENYSLPSANSES